MLTDTFLKSRFVDRILSEEAELIKNMQLEVVNDWGLEDHTGMLRQCLKGHFSVNDSGAGTKLTMRYVKYLRFIDMPWVSYRRNGLYLYNRIVFGRIYNDTSLRLRLAYQAGLSEDLIASLKQSLQ